MTSSSRDEVESGMSRRTTSAVEASLKPFGVGEDEIAGNAREEEEVEQGGGEDGGFGGNEGSKIIAAVEGGPLCAYEGTRWRLFDGPDPADGGVFLIASSGFEVIAKE